MYQVLQVVTVALVAVTMGLALAHAAEVPGKLRLDRDAYFEVQRIYYPGFAIGGGIGEFGGMIAAFVLLFATPRAAPELGWTLTAVIALVLMHGVFWFVTRPVNAHWSSPNAGVGGFFAFARRRTGSRPDWRRLRNIWEASHAVRAVLGLFALVCLTIATSL